MIKDIYTENDWVLSLYVSSYSTETYYFLHHRCLNDVDNTTYRYYWRHFDRPCYACKSLPEKTLQGMFVLLTGDMNEG